MGCPRVSYWPLTLGQAGLRGHGHGHRLGSCSPSDITLRWQPQLGLPAAPWVAHSLAHGLLPLSPAHSSAMSPSPAWQPHGSRSEELSVPHPGCAKSGPGEARVEAGHCSGCPRPLGLPACGKRGVADFREVFCNHLLQSVTATNGPGFEELTGKAAC